MGPHRPSLNTGGRLWVLQRPLSHSHSHTLTHSVQCGLDIQIDTVLVVHMQYLLDVLSHTFTASLSVAFAPLLLLLPNFVYLVF